MRNYKNLDSEPKIEKNKKKGKASINKKYHPKDFDDKNINNKLENSKQESLKEKSKKIGINKSRTDVKLKKVLGPKNDLSPYYKNKEENKYEPKRNKNFFSPKEEKKKDDNNNHYFLRSKPGEQNSNKNYFLRARLGEQNSNNNYFLRARPGDQNSNNNDNLRARPGEQNNNNNQRINRNNNNLNNIMNNNNMNKNIMNINNMNKNIMNKNNMNNNIMNNNNKYIHLKNNSSNNNNNNKKVEIRNRMENINDKPSSSEFSLKKFSFPPLVSLGNCGNTSYINIVLQSFANIMNISNYILKRLNIIEFNHKKMPITFLFSRILVHLFPLETDYEKKYSLQSFYNNFIEINPIFRGKTTKSAIDFLVYFVDKLDEEDKIIGNNNTKINSILKETEFQSIQKYLKHLMENKEDTIIFRTFSWINKKTEKCWECSKESITFQKYFTYDLNIENAINKTIMQYKNIITIFDFIKYASENKTLYNIYCKQCNKKNNKDVKSTIYLSQNLLIFLLRGIEKKENIEDMRSNKIKIQIDKDIDISDLVEDKKNSFKNYTLHGLIYYDIDKQEYFSYCVSPINAKWYEYIDESIRPANFNNFIGLINDKILPVILFYRHLDNQKK